MCLEFSTLGRRFPKILLHFCAVLFSFSHFLYFFFFSLFVSLYLCLYSFAHLSCLFSFSIFLPFLCFIFFLSSFPYIYLRRSYQFLVLSHSLYFPSPNRLFHPCTFMNLFVWFAACLSLCQVIYMNISACHRLLSLQGVTCLLFNVYESTTQTCLTRPLSIK